MNISRRLWAIVTVGLFLTIVSTATAKYSGGTGEPNDPYQIATAADLMALGETPEDYDKHFILTADIDLDPALPGRKVFTKAVIAPYTGGGLWIIFSGRSFTGIFNGDGHKISHLTIAGTDYVGLFGKLASDAKVKNLGLVGINIGGSHKVGGMTGENSGGIIRCYSTGVVTGSTDVGGLLGYAMGGDVTCSFSTAAVSGSLYVGGLVGEQWGTVSNCYSTGAVSCTWTSVGGLTGGNWGPMTNCYSTGRVTGSESVGGLSGALTFSSAVIDSFWDIQTSGQTTSSGGTGKTTAEMKKAATYTNWDFDGTWTIQEGMGYPRLRWEVYGPPAMVPTTVEKLSGDGKCSPAGSKLAVPLSVRVKNQDDEAMFDVQVKFTITAGGGKVEPSSTVTDSAGIASAVLTLGPTPGLNQVNATVDGLSVTFNVTGLAPGYGGGTGEPNDPYQIWTAEQINVIGAEPNDWGKHFKLMADIDLSGFDGKDGRCAFNVIGMSYADIFAGTFDGAGKTIRNLHSTLFGYLRGTVKNLRLADPNCVGSPIENNSGTVVSCCVQGGRVSGAGGLVGRNEGMVSHCYSTASISGSYAGGLVGRNGSIGTVTHCYSTGAVIGSSNGGLAGDCDRWATMLHCVWDMETSGLSNSAGGIGLTTAEMMDPNMLGLNGFANDPNWVLDAGRDYPRLAWEGTPGQMIPEPNVDWLEGDGTAEAPYRIHTADQLIMLGRASALWDKHFILGADIDLDPNLPNMLVFTQPPIQLFTGLFDGNHHTILHLTITGVSRLGLFGRLESDGEVRDLGVVDVNISGYRYIGGLVGHNRGTMTNCYSTGIVNASGQYTGGFYVGGLVGENVGPVTHSYSTATVSGTQWDVGGLFGYNGSRVQQCYSTGVVKGALNVGGLVGENGGVLIQCHSAGSVSGSSDIGGLVGDNRYGDMTDCYSTGAVKGGSKVGGLIGENWGAASRCYSSGVVTGSGATGGLVGNTGIDPWAFTPTVTDSFWDTQTSGRATSAGGTEKTTAEMQMESTFTDAGWDFVGETAKGTEDIWWIDEGKDYPRLWWEAAAEPPQF